MNCVQRIVYCVSNALERLGIYEPVITEEEARKRLCLEEQIWKPYQRDRSHVWNNFQANSNINGELHSLVKNALSRLKGDSNIGQRIAVDLGCGISNTAFNLLKRGWKVYAVDSSKPVIDTLNKVWKEWIKRGQLVLVNCAIEDFKYTKNVHLIVAIESLPYCDPKKISQIFYSAKQALHTKGVLVCNLFPYSSPLVDSFLRGMFGGWMTTKNVVEALMKSIGFSAYSVTDGRSEGGIAKQFHIFAQR